MCHTSAYALLSAYCRSVYRYKRMRLLTRVYGIHVFSKFLGNRDRPSLLSSPLLPSAWDKFKLNPVRPSRREIGYTTSAGYRLTSSHFSGVGFCTFAGLMETIKQCFFAPGVNELLALVRGETIQYWFIKLQLL